MELRVRDSSEFVDGAFGNWLLPLIRKKLISNIHKYNLVNWDNYFNTSDQVKRLYKKDSYSTANIILFAADHLICTSTPGEIVIGFNNTKFVPGFDRLFLPTAIKTINYGTLDVKGCTIFSDTLDEFAKDIDTYVELYYTI